MESKKLVFLVSFILFISVFSVMASAAILLDEKFENNNFGSRGWYDAPNGTISTVEHIPGSNSSFECFFVKGTTGCQGKAPARHAINTTEEVYLNFWIKYSANWIGSNKSYHPHEFHFTTNADGTYVGPAYSHLTTYTEDVGGRPMVALQDSKNVNMSCILLNNNNFIGCNGNFTSYVFSENRSACSCNGLMGDLDQRDCYNAGSYYYSSRAWRANGTYFRNETGPYYKNDWHFIESHFKMNSIVNGTGIADGVIEYWYDGQLLINYTHILFRTGTYPNLKFNQFIVAPYIGDTSPINQSFWVDELTISTTRIGGSNNTAPVLSGIPDQNTNEDTTPPANWVDLYPYASDAEDTDDALTFSIQSQTNSGLINCYISGDRYLDCGSPAANQSGYNDVTVKVTDTGSLTATDVVRITVNAVNDNPTITSASDSPDPVTVGNNITFTVDWNDVDSGEQTRIHICKTDVISGQVCTGGSWCDSASFATTDPQTCEYAAQAGDIGQKSYYAFVCDDNDACSASTAGTFTVQASGGAVQVFFDSFEDGTFNKWSQDAQNDWAVTTQRAKAGTRAAEVDGSAVNANLTSQNINLTGATNVNLTFSWYIESTWDAGEYICLDIYDGSWHNSVDCLDGNVDTENAWVDKVFDLDASYSMVSNFQVRFRAKVSDAVEDGFVDVVNVTRYA